MKLNYILWVAFGAALVSLSACKEEPIVEPAEPVTGDFLIEFEYQWAMNGEPFALNTELHHPMTGDYLTFSTFRHYVGHVELQDPAGEWWTDTEAYALFDAAEPDALTLRVTGVPVGDYTDMRLVLGVDSTHNVSGAQAGALDPAQGMFWNWNTGYIMVKAEGTSPQSATGSFAYHLGGFAGDAKVQSHREFALSDHGMLTVAKDAVPVCHFVANPAKLFHTYGSVANGENIHMPGVNAGIMGQDFHQAVYLDHIHP